MHATANPKPPTPTAATATDSRAIPRPAQPKADWNSVLSLPVLGVPHAWPLANSFGHLLPGHDATLVELLGIRPTDRVLDIGGGAAPFARADVVVEANPDDGSHRGGRAAVVDRRTVQARAEDLPFPDRHFDFVLSRQVFEHVDDPAAACRELMRVGRRGFLEMPAKAYDVLSGPNPGHQWFVSVVDGVLVFERRRFIRHPFGQPGLGALANSAEGQFLLHCQLRNVTNVQFYWEDEFAFEVHDDPDGYHYTDAEHRGLAHLDTAEAGLRMAGSPSEHRLADAEAAALALPDHARAHYVHGQWLWLLGQRRAAEVAILRASALAPDEPAIAAAVQCMQSQCPPLLPPAPAHAMDRRFWSEHSGEAGLDLHRMLAPAACAPRLPRDVDPTVSRFVRANDPATSHFVFPLPATWWSRGHEYEWARQFARPEHVVLDAACGISHPLKFALAQICRETHACDLDARIDDPVAIVADIRNDFGAAVADQFEPALLQRLHRRRCSITATPYAQGQFDRVFCISVLEHLPPADRAAALREFARLLRPDGLLVLTMDHPLVDLAEFVQAVAAAGLRFHGELRSWVPADALWSKTYQLRCFRALLSRAR